MCSLQRSPRLWAKLQVHMQLDSGVCIVSIWGHQCGEMAWSHDFGHGRRSCWASAAGVAKKTAAVEGCEPRLLHRQVGAHVRGAMPVLPFSQKCILAPRAAFSQNGQPAQNVCTLQCRCVCVCSAFHIYSVHTTVQDSTLYSQCVHVLTVIRC